MAEHGLARYGFAAREGHRSADEEMNLSEEDRRVIQEKFREVMYRAGLTLSAAQQMERSFKLLMLVLSEQRFIDIPLEQATELIEDRKVQPLKHIMAKIAKHVEFPEETRDELVAAIGKRNWFVHSFFWERGDQLANDATRPVVVKELKALKKTFDAAIQTTDGITDRIFRTFYSTSLEEMKDQGIRKVMESPNNGTEPIR